MWLPWFLRDRFPLAFILNVSFELPRSSKPSGNMANTMLYCGRISLRAHPPSISAYLSRRLSIPILVRSILLRYKCLHWIVSISPSLTSCTVSKWRLSLPSPFSRLLSLLCWPITDGPPSSLTGRLQVCISMSGRTRIGRAAAITTQYVTYSNNNWRSWCNMPHQWKDLSHINMRCNIGGATAVASTATVSAGAEVCALIFVIRVYIQGYWATPSSDRVCNGQANLPPRTWAFLLFLSLIAYLSDFSPRVLSTFIWQKRPPQWPTGTAQAQCGLRSPSWAQLRMAERRLHFQRTTLPSSNSKYPKPYPTANTWWELVCLLFHFFNCCKLILIPVEHIALHNAATFVSPHRINSPLSRHKHASVVLIIFDPRREEVRPLQKYETTIPYHFSHSWIIYLMRQRQNHQWRNGKTWSIGRFPRILHWYTTISCTLPR